VYRVLLAGPKEPTGRLDRLFLGMALTRLGACQQELDQQDEALAAHAAAVSELRTMKGDVNGMYTLGRALVEQARTQTKFHHRAEAERGLDEAVRLWEELSSRFRHVLPYREWHATALQVRGELRTTLNRLGDAGKDLDLSRSILEGLVKQFAAMPAYRRLLGRTCGAQGRLALARGNTKEAAARFGEAVKSLHLALEKEKENVLTRAWLEEFEREARRLGA
jgi:hypothetical protein